MAKGIYLPFLLGRTFADFAGFLLETYGCDIITRDSQCGCASVSLVRAQNGTGWLVGFENCQFL